MARPWGFLTNHALVLIHIGNHPRSTLREIAQAVGITERAALSILRLLQDDHLISRQKEGRRNRYWLDLNALMTHPLPGPFATVQELADALSNIARQLERGQDQA